MSEVDFERLRELYERADELPSGERAAFLDEACAGDAALRAELERMLSVEPGFLEPPRELALEDAGGAPERIGAFRVLGPLGEGGFGVVYRAEQLAPVRREVALKVLHPRRLDARSRLRFEAERQTLARLQHAGIARVYEAGETDEGRQFLAMELVEGAPLTEHCDRARLDLRARLALFLRVCAAVQHAHQRGVVHRDLKPSNVLVMEEDGRAAPKVIDFGVAKLLLDDGDREGTLTREGALIGTPGYMSPEQAAGRPVDTRTDVYALGVLLYDMLAGDLPFARERLSTRDVAEVLRILREEEPRSLTRAVQQAGGGADQVAARRGCRLDALLRALRGDLQWIVRKALAKDPEARYPTVAALAEDVERYLRSAPVSAREPAALYLARKFVARHRLGVGIVAAAALVLVAGVLGLLWFLREVDAARELADRQRDEAVLKEYAAQLAAARAALQIGDAARARRHLGAAAAEHRGWEWRHLAAQCEGSELRIDTGQPVLDVLWIDGDHALVPSREGGGIWNLRTGELVRALPAIEPEFDDICHDSANGRLVVDARTRLELWDLVGDEPPRLLLEPENDLRALALAPDGRTLATSENGGAVRLLDLEGERPPRALARLEAYAWALVFLDGGARLALGTVDGRLELRDAASGALEHAWSLGTEDVKALARSRDGRRLFAAAGGSVFALELASREVVARCAAEVEVTALRLSADGRTLYGAGGWVDGRLTAWDATTLEVVARYHGHRGGVESLDLHPADGRLLSGGLDGTVRVWPRRPAPAVRRLHVGYDARSLAVAADGEAFATVDVRGRASIFAARTLERERSVQLDEELWGCALGARELYACGPRLVAIDRRTGAVRAAPEVEGGARQLALDPGERWLVGVAIQPARALVWRLPELELAHVLELPLAPYVVHDPRRDRFALGGADGVLRWLDPERGAVVEELVVGEPFEDVSAGAGRLAVAAGGIRVLGPAGESSSSSAHGAEVTSLELSPDGRRLVTGGTDTLVRLWNLDDTELLVLDDAPKPVEQVHFVAGGERLIALSRFPGSPSYVLVWDAPHDASLR